MDMNNMNVMGNMGNTDMNMGYNSGGIFGNSFGGLFSLLINILFIVLIAAAVFALVMWAKRTYFKSTDGKTKATIISDPMLRTAVIIVAAIIGLALLFGLFGNFSGTGMGYGMNGSGMGYGMSGYSSFNITGIINILIQLLLILLVVSLVMALISYIKKLNDSNKYSSVQADDKTAKSEPDMNSTHQE